MIEGLNKHFESRVRLGVMALLSIHERVEFNTFKEDLGLTDGNLASHLSALEKNEYILVQKDFVGRKPRTQYQITKLGRVEFDKHLNALEILLNQSK
ncbi:MAG: transcriptional regulator [Crocinitomicaceae bacterium]